MAVPPLDAPPLPPLSPEDQAAITAGLRDRAELPTAGTDKLKAKLDIGRFLAADMTIESLMTQDKRDYVAGLAKDAQNEIDRAVVNVSEYVAMGEYSPDVISDATSVARSALHRLADALYTNQRAWSADKIREYAESMKGPAMLAVFNPGAQGN